ncbi:MAG: response regulator [Ardenticatenaceae bacterium]|nr:response regulator [Ardenticatenaceae bacterium]
MSDKIRILIVDDLPETRENVRKLLQFEPDVEVVGVAGSGDQAIEAARQQVPDVILMDINMPGTDGIGASQQIVQSVPHSQIIIMSVQSEADYLRRAMLAGARDFLMKPFSGDELMAAIRRVYETRPMIQQKVVAESADGGGQRVEAAVEEGKILTVFSPKGGAGCTTLAINTAVGLARKGYNTALIDGSLQFGDISVTLNMRPTTTIVDLIDRLGEIDKDLARSVLLKHDSGLNVLLAPPRPEMAELILADQMEALLRRLRQLYDFVIVDTPSSLNDVTLTALDVSDRILLVSQQSLSSLTGTRRFFDLMTELNYDLNKALLIINRVSDKFGISVKDVAEALKRPIVGAIEHDEFTATSAADRGVPLILIKTRRNVAVQSLLKLVDRIDEELSSGPGAVSAVLDDGSASKSLLGRLFSR